MGLRKLVSYRIVRRTTSVRLFLALVSLTFVVPVFWLSSDNREKIVQEALENVSNDLRYADVYRKTSYQPKHMKYILLWTSNQFSPFYFFDSGQRVFLKSNCSVFNCYITDNRNFFKDITQFDAIAFNIRNLGGLLPPPLPKKRSSHQKYIFFALESPENYPICNEQFDGFYNWTSTYRLESDIPYPYFAIKNMKGEIVGPKPNMVWDKHFGELDKELILKLQSKKKAVAWFVSNCSDKSGRRKKAKELEAAMAAYGLKVDTYGSCGNLKCPLDQKDDCDRMLERDYYFYLSFENSLDSDYVTEKLEKALAHNTVPIVYGGADYTRFLPPGSYLNARTLAPEDLAAKIALLITSPKLYQEYFLWKNHYQYTNTTSTDVVCNLCAALNNKTLVETASTYQDIRKWWDPNYVEHCSWMGAAKALVNMMKE